MGVSCSCHAKTERSPFRGSRDLTSVDRSRESINPGEATPEVLERFQRGDRSSYEVLFNRYRRPLLRFIRSHADKRFFAHVPEEDLLQEIHMEAIKGSRPTAGSFPSFSGYVVSPGT